MATAPDDTHIHSPLRHPLSPRPDPAAAASGPMPLKIEDLKRKTGVTDAQLDHAIDQGNIRNLADHFDCWEDYVGQPGFNLLEGEKTDVKDRAYLRGTISAIYLAISLWLAKNPYHTYRELVDILLQLKKGILADKVCKTVVKNVVVDDLKTKPPVQVPPSVSTSQGSNLAVREQIERFDRRFVDLRVAACKHMEQEGVPLLDFRAAMTSLPKDISNQNEDFVRKNYPVFMQAKTIEEIFAHLNFYLSFIDYGLLQHLINTFARGKALQKQMETYSEDMKLFRMETMISDIIPHLPQKSNGYSGASKLRLRSKIEVTTTSLEDLEAYRKRFASELLLSDFVLQLASIEESSLLITCFVPQAIVATLKKRIKAKDSSFFFNLHILEITVDKTTVYDSGQELQTVHSSTPGSDIIVERSAGNEASSDTLPPTPTYSSKSGGSPTLNPSSISRSPMCRSSVSVGCPSPVCPSPIMVLPSCGHQSPVSANYLSSPVQEQIDTTINAEGYFDIMLLGLTGQGKTTTGEKLLIANPQGVDYQWQHSFQSPVVDVATNRALIEDLSMWLIPSDQYSLERISSRMKTLAFLRSLENPSREISEAHESDMNTFGSTKKCELFSNETTKLRVLDVPGFFGEVQDTPPNSYDLILNAMRAHLGTMRDILRIQTTMDMKFKRILYFLPCRDTLQNRNAGLQQELQLMFYFFGRSIFENMVLVATVGPLFYRMVPEGVPIQIPEDELERSRKTFRQALEMLIPDDTPNPPIIFISLRETCESILMKVQDVEVNQDGLQLELNTFPCSRCAMTIGERNGERIACMQGNDWSQSMPYDESLCHPLLVPKYTRFQKVKKGIELLFGAVLHRDQWPDFSVLNGERCPSCLREIDSSLRHDPRGCTPMGSKYTHKDTVVVVGHTKSISENHRMLVQQKPLKKSIESDSYSSPSPMSVTYSRAFGNPESPRRRDELVVVDIEPDLDANIN